MNAAKAPPALPGANPPGGGDPIGQAGLAGLQMSLQQRHHARHGGQHRDALAVDGLDNPLRHKTALEVKLGGINGRNPQAHRLPEDVAQRQRMQNAQRMDQPLIAHVRL